MDGRVFQCTAKGTELRAWDVPGKIGSMALRKNGNGAIISLQQGFYWLDFKSGQCELIFDLEPNLPNNRINNGKVDRRDLFFAKVDNSNGGVADGSTVDEEGYSWNALVYDGKLIRYISDGRIDRIIEMPVKKVTSVNFGGSNMDVLYVTSMAKPPLDHLPRDNVLRGSLFAVCDLGIRGIPEPRFGA